jgi:hypothetical protein
MMTAEGPPMDRALETNMFTCTLSREPIRRCSITTHHTYFILMIQLDGIPSDG